MDYDIPDLEPREKPFQVHGKSFTLREPSEAAAIRYRSSQLQGAKMVDGKLVASIERAFEGQSLLVSLCVVDAEGKPVSLETVRTWPARTVKALFALAQSWGDMEEETEESLARQGKTIQEKLQALREARENGHPQPASATSTS